MFSEIWKAIGGENARLMPEAASTFAIHDDKIMLYLLAVSGVFTAGIFSTLLYFAIKYRHRPGNEVARAVSVSYALELTWTLVPFAIVLVAFFWGANRYIDKLTPRDNAENVYVIGKQWMWKVEHENGVSEINQLHVPVGRDTNLLMISQDVIHSFFVPDFRAKYDVLPGRYTRLWFRPQKPGVYYLFCTQYCGMDHARMTGQIVAMNEADYQTWLDQQKKPLSDSAIPAKRGERLFSSHGCISCHGPGRTIGPPLLGRFARGDEDDLRESILRPSTKIKAGYKDLMPTFAGLLSEEDILDLIAYLISPSKMEVAHD